MEHFIFKKVNCGKIHSKIYSLDHFWCTYGSIVLSTFTLLCNQSPLFFMSQNWNSGGLVQDGRVGGHVLTPSCKSTGITTNCWTIINRKTLELTKTDTPHPKTKEKLQWDSRRGAITIKSNPIATGWVTHKLENNHTTKVHPLEWGFWAPPQASWPEGPATGGGIPRESDFEA